MSAGTEITEIVRAYPRAVAILREMIDIAAKHGIDRRRLATLAGLSDQALRGYESEEWSPTMRVMEPVAATLRGLQDSTENEPMRRELARAQAEARKKLLAA
jgi:transcriptional regulator with XRE-family HTH domain